MAQLTVNGVPVEIAAPVSIEDEVLENHDLTQSGLLSSARHGTPVRAFRVPIQTTIMTTTEKETLEAELLKTGTQSIGGDLFGSAIPCYVTPRVCVPGPLTNQWVWFFEIEEAGS
jgi:hypothetical protein